MNDQQFAGGNEQFLRRYEYDDSWVIAADLGHFAGDVDVDIVGDTAILVVDNGESVSELDFQLPGEGAKADLRNGVLTITVAK